MTFFPGYLQDVSWLVMVWLCCSLVESLLIFHAALRQAGDKLPTTVEFIDRKTPPRLGNLLLTPQVNERLESSSTSTSSS
ncbi:hypothetical protein F5888DRAFT_1681448 [Russula emetica]|nr:hypothetical protein F5888DRAFT_1681448 [Russula emetica]